MSRVRSVRDAGPGFTIVEYEDGTVERRTGVRASRNNNPGNIEFGDYARRHGAVGTDGRFAVFATPTSGLAAKENLIFNSPSYAGLTIEQAIGRYAPHFENNTAAYAAAVARAAGVPVDTPMSNLNPEQRQAALAEMSRVEGNSPYEAQIVERGSPPTPPSRPDDFSVDPFDANSGFTSLGDTLMTRGAEAFPAGSFDADRAINLSNRTLTGYQRERESRGARVRGGAQSSLGGVPVNLEDLSPEALSVVNAVAAQLPEGTTLTVNSGYRTPDQNERVGGAGRSRHLDSLAADINLIIENPDGTTRSLTPQEQEFAARAALQAGATEFGFGNDYMHVAVDRPGTQTVPRSYTDLPSWAYDSTIPNSPNFADDMRRGLNFDEMKQARPPSRPSDLDPIQDDPFSGVVSSNASLTEERPSIPDNVTSFAPVDTPDEDVPSVMGERRTQPLEAQEVIFDDPRDTSVIRTVSPSDFVTRGSEVTRRENDTSIVGAPTTEYLESAVSRPYDLYENTSMMAVTPTRTTQVAEDEFSPLTPQSLYDYTPDLVSEDPLMANFAFTAFAPEDAFNVDTIDEQPDDTATPVSSSTTTPGSTSQVTPSREEPTEEEARPSAPPGPNTFSFGPVASYPGGAGVAFGGTDPTYAFENPASFGLTRMAMEDTVRPDTDRPLIEAVRDPTPGYVGRTDRREPQGLERVPAAAERVASYIGEKTGLADFMREQYEPYLDDLSRSLYGRPGMVNSPFDAYYNPNTPQGFFAMDRQAYEQGFTGPTGKPYGAAARADFDVNRDMGLGAAFERDFGPRARAIAENAVPGAALGLATGGLGPALVGGLVGAGKGYVNTEPDDSPLGEMRDGFRGFVGGIRDGFGDVFDGIFGRDDDEEAPTPAENVQSETEASESLMDSSLDSGDSADDGESSGDNGGPSGTDYDGSTSFGSFAGYDDDMDTLYS